MQLGRMLVLTAVVAGLVAAAPASAGPGHRGGEESFGERPDAGDVPSRVANRVRRADRALDRAEERIDEGETTGAVNSLGAVDRNLAGALKAALRRVSQGAESGPASAWAVAAVQHRAIAGTSALFDGSDGAVVDALASTLDGAIDGRDELIAAIGTLSDDTRADYYGVLEEIDEDIADELEAIDEALSDDTLTPEAEAALNSAKTKLEASQSAVQALLSEMATADAAFEENEGSFEGARDGDDGRECDRDRDGSGETFGAGPRGGGDRAL